ncbi:hypothetical protein [Actinomadura alba]|uniref:Uncharacterized protein n=1 Tax=Actinomadura alba TaxID=406431 RepID=A0ABR7LUK0_9ACTN|nr:hypothetical protein [Actinomadura alba]MBC6468515.1 hypothetical protein [Actinomadura alba]
MEHDLDYRDQVFINFRDFFGLSPDHAYRWVDLKQFCLPSTIWSDAQLLGALIRHDQFRDDYAGGGVDPTGMRHGPYWLDRITVNAYEPLDEATALNILHVWVSQYGELPQTLELTLERDVHALVRAATSRYRLKVLGEDSLHDWGGVHGEFHELALIDRDTHSLALIVAADD